MAIVLLAVLCAVLAVLLLRRRPAPPVIASRRDHDRAAVHVERFTRALEQCTNPAKRGELERNLRYWTLIQQAEEG